jgi:hypothetical protein
MAGRLGDTRAPPQPATLRLCGWIVRRGHGGWGSCNIRALCLAWRLGLENAYGRRWRRALMAAGIGDPGFEVGHGL